MQISHARRRGSLGDQMPRWTGGGGGGGGAAVVVALVTVVLMVVAVAAVWVAVW